MADSCYPTRLRLGRYSLMNDIDTTVAIIHYSPDSMKTHAYINEVLGECIRTVKDYTTYPHLLKIIDNGQREGLDDVKQYIPLNAEYIHNDGKWYTFPAGCNLAIERCTTKYLALIQTDIKVGFNWLGSLIADLKVSEEKYHTPCAVIPILLPYPAGQVERFKSDWWRINRAKYSPDQVHVYMDGYGVPHKEARYDEYLAVSQGGLVTNNGPSLGVYAASMEFFKEVGLYDPEQYHINDRDYGIQALMTRCHVLTANLVWLHHMGALHRWEQGVYMPDWAEQHGVKSGSERFIEKWGQEIYTKMMNGSIWQELHDKQDGSHG